MRCHMVAFKDLWSNYPKSDGIEGKCFHKKNKPFDNYCAIKMSECFIQSGISLSHFKGTRCWSHSGPKHLLRAEELAKALDKSTPNGFGTKEAVKPADFQSLLKGKTGVIFFKDYWRRGKESFANRSGDHIDLWNKDAITGSSMWMRSIVEFFSSSVSDLNQSKEVWFWEVK